MSYLVSPPTVIFNGTDLNAVDGLLVEERQVSNIGDKATKIYKLASTSKSVLTASEYATKLIIARVAIARSSRELLDQSIDTLYGYLQGVEKSLDIVVSGQTRRFTATVTRITTKNVSGGFARIDIEFTCSDPFGYELTETTLLDTTITSSSSTTNITVGGSGDATPIITVDVTAVTGGTNKSIIIRNGETGVGITVKRNWTAGDTLTINGINKEVRVNGVLFAATGKTPHFEPGLRVFSHSDDFTTRTLDITATYYKRYI